MASSKEPKLNYDKRGGVIVISREMLNSERYQDLPAQAKVLMILLHIHWRNTKPVDYGVREAAARIPCAKPTAQKAFKALEKGGFIVKIDESLFHSRTMSKSRTWRLTWMPYRDKNPTHDWEKIESTGSKL